MLLKTFVNIFNSIQFFLLVLDKVPAKAEARRPLAILELPEPAVPLPIPVLGPDDGLLDPPLAERPAPEALARPSLRLLPLPIPGDSPYWVDL